MADIFYTVRKITLPKALFEAVEVYFELNGNFDYKARHLVDLCMDKVDSFNSLAVYVSGIREYQNFLATIFNKKTTAITLFFKRSYWERVCRVQNEHNIGCGDIFRLILASLLFNSGTIALPLEKLSRLFISERQAYTYNTVLTQPVAGLLQETEKSLLPVNRETIIRASHCYFSAALEDLPLLIANERYRVDNGTTGWSRQTVSGSLEMKAYFHLLKQSTGEPLSAVIAHTAYSFLEKLREASPDEKR
jgi:hypothetical protein